MKAVIMAGGFGTRLRPLTCNIPKPLVPVACLPVMEHNLQLLKKYGITECIVLLYHQPELIRNYFGDGGRLGLKLHYTQTAEDIGTAGSVKNAQKYLDNTFIIISADLLTDFDLGIALDFHKNNQSEATLILTRVDIPLSFGVVITSVDGRIQRFLEKPTWGEVFSDLINTGIYILEPEVLDYIPQGENFDFSKNLFPGMMAAQKPLFGCEVNGYWRDIGNLKEYRLVHRDILDGSVRLNLPSFLSEQTPGIWVGKNCNIDSSVIIKGNCIIGNSCDIRENVILKNTVIGSNCIIGSQTVLDNCVVWDDVYIGPQTEAHEAVIANKCEIRSSAFISNGAVIGEGCNIGSGSTISQSVKIWPHKHVDDEATLSHSLVWGEKWTKSLFGFYGVTGLANLEITPEFAAKLGAAYGAALGKGAQVNCSRDEHKTSRMIHRALISGIMSAGASVNDLRSTPIPIVKFDLSTLGRQGGLHVRKSPYNPHLLDIKFFDEKGLSISSGQEKKIENLFYREDFRRASIDETGTIFSPPYVLNKYQEGFLHHIDVDTIRSGKLRIVLDYANGSSSGFFPSILGNFGTHIVTLNGDSDATRITKTPNQFQESQKELADIVGSLRADMGFLMDAGAEKVFICDETGRLLNDTKSLALMVYLVCSNADNPVIAVPVTASRVIDKIVSDFGGKVIRTRTAASSMEMAALDNNVNLVGDNSAGFIFPRFSVAFDAMMAISKIMELAVKSGKSVSSIVDSLPEIPSVKARVHCAWEKKGRVMRRLIEENESDEKALIDGVEMQSNGGWALILPDPDASYFHVYTESETEESALDISREFIDKIKAYQEDIS